MVEEWKEVVISEGRAEVSNIGRVRSLDRFSKRGKLIKGRILKYTTANGGYPQVVIYIKGKSITRKVHRLVMEAFKPIKEDEKDPQRKMTVNHIDGNKANNRIDNLEWMSKADNIKHAVETGLFHSGESNGRSKLKEKDVKKICDLLIQEEYLSYSEIADLMGIHKSRVRFINEFKVWDRVTKPYLDSINHLYGDSIRVGLAKWELQALRKNNK